jgi:hypothetical protein
VIALLVDLVVAGLLLATLSYCILLNRRLAALRDDKGELRELIRGLTSASQRAEAGVAALRQAADHIGVGLQQEIDRARELREDLVYMLERGGALADRLEVAIRHRREDPRPPVRPPAAPNRTEPGREAGRPATGRPDAARAAAGPTAEPKGGRPRIEPQGPVAAAPETASAAAAASRVASFPSRVERDLRRVLEGRR